MREVRHVEGSSNHGGRARGRHVGDARGIRVGVDPAGDSRLTHDASDPGYVTSYFIARQNEPAVGVDPRDTDVILGSSNDYCGVYNDGEDAEGSPLPIGPIWLGH